MAQIDPFTPPPGPVRQYVDRAMQIATKVQLNAAYDIAADVDAFTSNIKEQAHVLKPAGDGDRFLAAVKGQLGMMAGDSEATRAQVFRTILERLS